MSSAERTYKPELQPRRGEYVAWLLFAGTLAGVIILWFTSHTLLAWAVIFAAFLLLSAASISLGNWMDRSSELRVSDEGVAFTNGLRHVSLKWSDIEKVELLPARWNQKVRVLGNRVYFEYPTLGDVKYNGETQWQIGFSRGTEIMAEIIQKSGLVNKTQSNGAYTYSRS